MSYNDPNLNGQYYSNGDGTGDGNYPTYQVTQDQSAYDEYGQPIYTQNQLDDGYYDPNEQYVDGTQFPQGQDPSQDQGPYNNDASYYNQPPNMMNPSSQDGENFSDFSSYGPPSGTYPNDQYTPSQMSYPDQDGSSGASTPYGNGVVNGNGQYYDPNAIEMALPNDPYPAWTADPQSPCPSNKSKISS